MTDMPKNSKWQPIETAPKGRKVLVGKVGSPWVYPAWWDSYCERWISAYFPLDYFLPPTHWREFPDPRALKKLICALVGHRYVVQRVFSPTSRKVCCTRCGKEWGMNDSVRAFVPWDGELEQLYQNIRQWPDAKI
jgi:hypothetical protein